VERKLGRFELPDPEEEYPVDYVLDGQQRLTSIFTVFQTELTPKHDPDWVDIYLISLQRVMLKKVNFAPFWRQTLILESIFLSGFCSTL
jgi:hypothetical protein